MVRRRLHGLVVVLVLALAGAQPPAQALPSAPQPVTEAASPCHGAEHGSDAATPDADTPACCPDGCPGHCMIAAAMIPAVPDITGRATQDSRLVWSPLTPPSWPPGTADRPPRA